MNNDDRELLFHKYMRTSKMMFHKTHESVEQVGLSRGQPPLLMSLWRQDKQSRRELCECMDRKPATITKMVKRLENNGFVSSQMDPIDSRISRVCLTDKGRNIEECVKSIHTQLHLNIFKDLSNEELDTFEALLDKIRENMLGMETINKENKHE